MMVAGSWFVHQIQEVVGYFFCLLFCEVKSRVPNPLISIFV